LNKNNKLCRNLAQETITTLITSRTKTTVFCRHLHRQRRVRASTYNYRTNKTNSRGKKIWETKSWIL